MYDVRNWMRRKAVTRIPDNSTCTVIVRVRNRFIGTQSRRGLTDRQLDLSIIQANTVLSRGGDGCLCVARQSLFLNSFSPLLRSVPLTAVRRDNWGRRSGWTTLSPLLLEISPFFPRIVDESIGHPAAFCPLFAATLSMYYGCRRWLMDESKKRTERKRERESGFDFISRMNMQPCDSHRHNYRAAASVASLH